MSFSYYDKNNGFNYAGTGISGYFSQKINLFSPKHYRFLLNIKKLNMFISEIIIFYLILIIKNTSLLIQKT